MSTYTQTRYTFDKDRAKVWKAIAEYLQRYVDRTSETVLDLGAGYCDFINNIAAKTKLAVDLDPSGIAHAGGDVRFIVASIDNLQAVPENSVDVLFASNLLEHLDDKQLESGIAEFGRILKRGGKVILLQPNFRYAYREYFDDYTHKRIFTHVSLCDFFVAHGYEPLEVLPRFLPFSLKSRLPKSYILTKIYLWSPYKPMAKQMLLVLRRRV